MLDLTLPIVRPVTAEPEPSPALVRSPEIQATVKAPAVRNFRMAVTLYYMFAMSLWIVITVVGYWCFPRRFPDPIPAPSVLVKRSVQWQAPLSVCLHACVLYHHETVCTLPAASDHTLVPSLGHLPGGRLCPIALLENWS